MGLLNLDQTKATAFLTRYTHTHLQAVTLHHSTFNERYLLQSNIFTKLYSDFSSGRAKTVNIAKDHNYVPWVLSTKMNNLVSYFRKS